MQEHVPLIAETGSMGTSYCGDYPAKLMMALRRFPKGRNLRQLMDHIDAMPGQLATVEESLRDLVELGIVEKVAGKEILWRVSH